MSNALSIRAATADDIPLITAFIRELAEYEKLDDEVVATEEQLRVNLFGPAPQAEVLIADYAGEPAGFALFFHNFSTFLGRRGLYLEDLFVRPAYRGKGIGKALLVKLAQLAEQRGCGRFEWAVLDWNEPAKDFYRNLGAHHVEHWEIFRVTGPALTRLAKR